MVTAALVKELREKTGAGMMDCKKVLTETDGDLEKAAELLREKGITKAAKKSGRVAAEGMVEAYISEDEKVGAIVEVNSETDFVAKNEEFRTFVMDVAKQIVKNNPESVEALLAEPAMFEEGKTVQEALVGKIATIGEKLDFRRFEKLTTEGQIAGYIHGAGKIGVLVELLTEARDERVIAMGRDIAMQVAAMNPKYVSRDDVDAEYLAHETEVLTAQALNEGKPANIVEKMVKGRLEKELKEVCLLEQVFVKDSDLTIKKLVANTAKEVGSDIQVGRVVRFEVGEGIEKKEENFAEEVAKQLK